MQFYDELISELSELCGIVSEYWDIFGKKHVPSLDTKKAVLRAMHLNIETADDIVREIKKRRAGPWRCFLEPVHVVSVNARPVKIPLYIPVKEGEEDDLMISWSLEDEHGRKKEFRTAGAEVNISEQQWLDGLRYVRADLDIGQRDIGYYVMNVQCRHPERIFPGGHNKLQKRSKVIIAPDACYLPNESAQGRTWGLSLNLYAMKSGKNWGIGDLGDLKKIVRWLADLNGDFVGINPLHSIPNTKPFGVSPYVPISRLYKNFIYLDMEKIPEVAESEEMRREISTGQNRKELDELRKETRIDYERVASLKEKILKKAFDIFYEKQYAKNTKRGKYFKKFIAEEGDALESYAVFMALLEHMKKTKKVFVWQDWPREYHDPSGKPVREFRKIHDRSVLFYQYVQWLIHNQLTEISDEAKTSGLKIGLYHDLAIGSVGGGSDVWSHQNVFAGNSDVGAPPDDFSLDGQKWGFPPSIPEELRDSGYELFIQTMRKNMKCGGALRIDHALGLFRLFWVPDGMTPKDGAYVSYPHEDLLRIIALESVRNKTVVIAEDLGTMGDNVREALQRYQMLSYRLFYFERNYPDPSFLSPEKYPEMALCAVTTHDLPTIYGYWAGRDIEVRKQMGKYCDESLWRQQVNDRERDKGLILTALKSQGIMPDFPSDPVSIPEMTPELCLAIYRYLALTPCKLLLVSLDDIIGTLNQQNMPGTVDTYPNWVQKTPMTLDEIISDKRFTDLSVTLRRHIAVSH
jgi:4-alpha-glucanotransferase